MKNDVSRIAIVGSAARLAVGRGREDLASAMIERRSPFRPLPKERFDPAVFARELPEGAPARIAGALIEDHSLDFRALRLPPMAVEKMHRMERVALATMAEALADAGIRGDHGPEMRGRIVLAAAGLGPDPATDHGRRIRRFELAAPVAEAVSSVLPDQRATIEEYVEQLFNLAAPPVDPDSMATSASVLAGRIANLFDFRGGHFAIDTGASSSFAALAEAVDALRTGDADRVLVCGISPLLTASRVLAHAHRAELGAGVPRPGAADADGTVLGEGCVAFVLQREHDVRGPVLGFLEGIGRAVVLDEPASRSVARAAREALEDAGGDPEGVAAVLTRTAGLRDGDAHELVGLEEAYGRRALRWRSVVPQTGFLGPSGGMSALLAAVHALATRDGSCIGPDLSLDADSRLGVSDAGGSGVVFHAIVAGGSSRARTRSAPSRPLDDGPIAIVGVGACVPGANDAPTFFRNVVEDAETFDDLPPSRFDVGRLIGASRELGSVLTSSLAGTLDRPDLLGRLDERERAGLSGTDPSVAMCLVSGAEAVLGAGFDGSRWDPDRVAVLVGQLPLRELEVEAEKRVLFAGHLQLVVEAMLEAGISRPAIDAVVRHAQVSFDRLSRSFDAATLDAFSGLGAAEVVARRFGFRGGLACIDAACASSLVAIDIARRKLQNHELDAVVVGGVAANILPEYYITLGMLGFLSPDGHPPFDERSDGFVPAEAAAFVVLRRVEDARAAGERIVAQLRSTGLSSDGRTSSVLAPSSRGQRLSIERALGSGDATPRTIDALEVHGAGTRLGDRTEMQTYAATYGARDGAEMLAIGTVKSQIGHTSSASGLVSIVKMAMALDAGVLPPSRVPTRLDTELGIESVPFAFARVARPWGRRPSHRRRAAISAFGLGGVNTHVILEEAPPMPIDAAVEPLAVADEELPLTTPEAGLVADRFTVELCPLAIPRRPPRTPVRGRKVLLLRDRGDLHRTVAAALTRRGAEVTSIDDAAIDATVCERIDFLVDLGELGARDGRCLDLPVPAFAELVRAQYARLMRVFRSVYERLSDAPSGAVTFACVTDLGGTLGTLPYDQGDPLGASVLGMIKGLKQELPHAHVKAIDLVTAVDRDAAVEAMIDELEDGNDRMEVALRPARWVTQLRRASFPPEQRVLRPIRPGDVYVFSGGGRGVAFECATSLASLGAKVVVTGRTELDEASLAYAAMDDTAFEEFRHRELVRRRSVDRTITPARFAEEFDRIASRREILRNLERSKRFGLGIEYVRCDVTDPEAVRRCLADVRARHGRVDAVVHAAMVEWSRSLPKKTDQDVERTVATKVVGLRAIAEAIEHEPVGALIAFGSGAGRFGNRGQVDYSGANAAMAALLPQLVRRLDRPMHAVTIDWTAWASVGAAANPALASLVAATGVTSITPEEGRYWFVSELVAGRSDEVVIFEERMLSEWPFLGSRADGEGERRVYDDDRGELLVPGEWPMIDLVVERSASELRVERTFDLRTDPFLDHHRLLEVPIVPATFGLELLAETAALALPGFHLRRGLDVRIGVPLKLFHERPLHVSARARAIDEGDPMRDLRRLEVVVSSTFARRGLPDEERVHVSGVFELARGERVVHAPQRRASVPPPSFEIPEEATRHARSFFHLAKDPVRLGPLFCNAHGLAIGDGVVVGGIAPPAHGRLMQRTRRPRFQVDPMVLDAAFQIAANWDGRRNGWVSIPFGVDEIVVHDLRRDDEPSSVRAQVARVNDPDVHYDFEIHGADERPLLTVRGLHLRRIASLEQES